MDQPSLDRDTVAALTGPILVLGAGGFVGAHLFRHLLAMRSDVFGGVRHRPTWRLAQVNSRHLLAIDITNRADLCAKINAVRPATVFHCAAYGAYSFENDGDRIYRTNFLSLIDLIELLQEMPLAAFVHAGTSSEYGTNCAGPVETAPLCPNSSYAISKVAASASITYAGKTLGLPIINLRLYSVYGPYEDSSRLIPNLVKCGLAGTFPALVSPDTSRDFVYIADVCDAFVMAAASLRPDIYGDSFNIATGTPTTIRTLAETAATVFGITQPPSFGTMAGRRWDLCNWYGAPQKAAVELGWTARTPLAQGLRLTADWVRSLGPGGLEALTKRPPPPARP